MSLAGQEAATQRQAAAATMTKPNFRFGPTIWSFGADLKMDASDNVTLAHDNPEADLIFRPDIDARMLWPVSDLNNINLSLGVGYDAYVSHPEFDHPFVAPNTELSYDVYAGDFWINFHDRFSISDIGYLDPTASGVGDYELLNNAAGVGLVWDLNRVVAKLGVDQVDSSFLGNNQTITYPPRSSEVASASAGYWLHQGLQAGLETGGATIRYSGAQSAVYADASQWNAGPYAEAKLSEYLWARLSAGYNDFTPQTGGGSRGSGLYAQATVTHRINERLDYSLSGGRTFTLAYSGSMLDDYFVRLQANFHVLEHSLIGASFDYDHGSYSYAGGETFARYGFGLSIRRELTTKLVAILSYGHYLRQSDVVNASYTLNRAGIELRYKF